MEKRKIDIDALLKEVGEFGRYQKSYMILLGLALMFTASSTLSFLFTTGDMKYRCYINDCDSSTSDQVYNPEWLKNAVPFIDKYKPSKCQQFEKIKKTNYTCSALNFNKSSITECNSFIFASDSEKTIVSAFHIYCRRNKWKLTTVGTLNNIGQFISLPISGFLSDKYGRKNIIIIGSTLAATCGILRSMSFNYMMFLILEFCDALFSGGVYSATFIMGLGLIGGKHRVFASTALSGFYPIGEALVGVLFWYVQDWRKFLIIMNFPGLFFILAYRITPESVRWLITAGKIDKAIEELKCIAKFNGKNLSDETLKKLEFLTIQINKGILLDENEANSRSKAFRRALSSKCIMTRLLNCSFCWMINTLVYYGLSLNASAIVGNPYGNFILSALIEIPALIIVVQILNKFGRRESQCVTLLLCSALCLSIAFIPNNIVLLNVTLYLLGKFVITVSFVILYMYTAEMFPTEIRHSLLGICSMFGRIGSMVAPQSPLLVSYFGQSAPIILFSGATFVAGCSALFFPETFNKKMPDTVLEAEAIGRKR
ncbi:organic cation transporter-like protein isoform X2 [Daktulosphaira vitifoliae]|uniref:organic cation transporter-like protein isoform X2 n=1 Tax=Daktulosphaira vitifoliae TaxID=58002 RepID=UPI0021A9CB5C|nr:organic cation transporter-like protein isoform X2 [Daktulosphaira vitifoliae]